MTELIVALAGNPNAGKTTLFNALTGLNQHVGNWPGKTIAKKEGLYRSGDVTLHVVDLPGTYSLTAFSPDEIIARDFIVNAQPDVVINVVDAANLERNLYLTLQLLELGAPLILALNMMDVAAAQGLQIDQSRLGRLLGDVPVVATTANRERGIAELVAAVVATAARSPLSAPLRTGGAVPGPVQFGGDVDRAIGAITAEMAARQLPLNGYQPGWTALKLLEADDSLRDYVAAQPGGAAVLTTVQGAAERLNLLYGDSADILTADQRYGFISGLARQVVDRPAIDRVTLSDRIDNVVTHRVFGLPLFLAVMYLVFKMVVDVSTPFLNWIDTVINGPIVSLTTQLLTLFRAPAWLTGLVVDGVIAGVGAVLVFIPGLIVIYLFLAFLEDSGYLARAAFVMDRFMRTFGLHGKSVIPLILGFGCAVPAVYATRTMASRRDRILTALLIPLMSCSARLPVYVIFGLAFFGSRASTAIWLLYALGIVIALASGFLFSRTILPGATDGAFVLELPPYRMPAPRGLWIHMWRNTSEFLRKAGTTIFAFSLLLWLLLNLPWGVAQQRDSYFGRVSGALAPLLAPAGLNEWEVSGALVGGLVAKEMVVTTLAQTYGVAAGAAPVESVTVAGALWQTGRGFAAAVAESGRRFVSLLPGIEIAPGGGSTEDPLLSQALRANLDARQAAALLVFVLLYVPCIATIGAIRQEFGARWAALSVGYQTALAWLLAVGVYQTARLLGL